MTRGTLPIALVLIKKKKENGKRKTGPFSRSKKQKGKKRVYTPLYSDDEGHRKVEQMYR